MTADRTKLLACLISGALLPLAYAPFDYFWIAPATLAVLFWCWRDCSPGQAFRRGFAYGFAGFLAGMYWIYISVHDFGEAPAILAVSLMLALVAAMASFAALTGWVSARFFDAGSRAAWLAVMPAVWVLAEWLRGFVLTGFGWLSSGYSQTDTWLMGYAPLVGLHGMTWAVALTAGALAVLVAERGRARWLGLVSIALLWGGGYVATGQRWVEPRGALVSVALVQGAVPQDLKWDPEQLIGTMELYRRLTLQAMDKQLIVWPEAAIPALYSQVKPFVDQVGARVAARGGTLLAGVLRAEPGADNFQNALMAFTDPPAVYTKRHLVPFGEYFPVPAFVRSWMRLMSLPYVDAEPGPAGQPPLAIAGEKIAVTICYEDVFGAEQLHYMPEASLLVNVSNDAWFGTSIAPHQHLQIARLRAAEVGRYQLRATNTGITAVIGPKGEVIRRLPQFEPGVLESHVQGFTGLTPYARFGNYPVVVGALLTLLAQFAMTKLTMRPGT
jgi:apolipoprotein N-acyltransferase